MDSAKRSEREAEQEDGHHPQGSRRGAGHGRLEGLPMGFENRARGRAVARAGVGDFFGIGLFSAGNPCARVFCCGSLLGTVRVKMIATENYLMYRHHNLLVSKVNVFAPTMYE